jgi:hypothetical protein
MQIGFIRQESMSVKDKNEAGSEVVKWLECHFRIAGIRPFSAKMTPNKRKEKPNQPDFIIYLRANVNKKDSFRDIAIGSLWLGEKLIDGVMKKFMTGTLEVAFTKVSIAVWKAEPRFDGEVINYLYDIKTMEDKRDNDQGYQGGYQEDYTSQAPVYDQQQPQQYQPQQQNHQVVEDEIPF